MPRSRFSKLPQDRRDAILDVAARHFAEGGFEGASYNRILEDAGLSKSSAYYLFEGKTDLYGAVLEREIGALFASVPPPPSPADIAGYWAATRSWLAATLAFLADHPQCAALVAGYVDARQRSAAPDLDREIEGATEGAVTALVAAGQRVGAVRTDVDPELLDALATALLSALDRHFLPRMRPGEDPGPLDSILDLYLDTLRRLLQP